jgi:hypothetical protein
MDGGVIMKKFWFVMMALMLAAGFGTMACGGDDDDSSGDTDADTDTDADADTDTDADSDTDTDADCGGIDSACCTSGTACTDTDAVCVTNADSDQVCMSSCVPDLCTDEGYTDTDNFCIALTDPADPLAYCYVADDEAVLAADNACDGATYAGGWFCCPRSMGGDEYGNGTAEGDAGVNTMCGDIDLATLATPGSYLEGSSAGVGLCLTNSTGDAAYCLPGCAYTNSCDALHTCIPLTSGTGACEFYTAK